MVKKCIRNLVLPLTLGIFMSCQPEIIVEKNLIYKCAAPELVTAPGTYYQDFSVPLFAPTDGAEIHYTLDGVTDPDKTSPVYVSGTPIPVTGNGTTLTIRAIAIKEGLLDSDLAVGTYTLMYKAPVPNMDNTIFPGEYYYPSSYNITLQQIPAGVTYRFTLDDTPVTETSPVWVNQTLDQAKPDYIIRIKAFQAGFLPSDEIRAVYKYSRYYEVKQAVAAGYSSFALRFDGTILSWGYNGSGQLGYWNGYKSRPSPLLDGNNRPFTGASYIWAGEGQLVIQGENDQVYSLGANGGGRLGDGTTVSRGSPVLVLDDLGKPLKNLKSVAIGSNHTLYLLKDGTVLAGGYNSYGALGTGDKLPITNLVKVKKSPTEVLGQVTSVAVSNIASYFLMADGTLLACGNAQNGLLGNGVSDITVFALYPAPVLKAAGVPLTGVKALASAYGSAMVILEDSTAWAWGFNGTWELGVGDALPALFPRQVRLSASAVVTGAVSLVAGGNTNYGIVTSDGGLLFLGNLVQTASQFARPYLMNSTTPISGGIMPSLGFKHLLYIDPASKRLMSAGLNFYFALGTCPYDGQQNFTYYPDQTYPVYVGAQ